jgi:hypothetical protein
LSTDSFSAKAASDLLKSKGIDFVRIQWVDYCNMIVFSVLAALILAFPGYSVEAIPLFHKFIHKEISRHNESQFGPYPNRYDIPRLHRYGRVFPDA